MSNYVVKELITTGFEPWPANGVYCTWRLKYQAKRSVLVSSIALWDLGSQTEQ
jgi:hypothetical protein